MCQRPRGRTPITDVPTARSSRPIDAVEAAAPDGFARIDDVIGRREREAIVKGYVRLAGFAPDQVNHVERPARRALPRG